MTFMQLLELWRGTTFLAFFPNVTPDIVHQPSLSKVHFQRCQCDNRTSRNVFAHSPSGQMYKALLIPTTVQFQNGAFDHQSKGSPCTRKLLFKRNSSK